MQSWEPLFLGLVIAGGKIGGDPGHAEREARSMVWAPIEGQSPCCAAAAHGRDRFSPFRSVIFRLIHSDAFAGEFEDDSMMN